MKTLVKDTFIHWNKHKASRMGAALSYYAVFSFIPLLVLLMTISSALFTTHTIQQGIAGQLTETVGPGASQYITNILQNNHFRSNTDLSSILSILVLIVGALGMFTELTSDLNELWEVTDAESKQHTSVYKKILAFLHSRTIPLLLIPLLAVLMVTSIGVTIFIALIKDSVVFPLTLVASLIQVAIPLVLTTVLFMLVYKILPKRNVPWKILLTGGLVTATLFIIGNILIGLYIKMIGQSSTFGGASSWVGLLVWMYYSAQVFFLGASFTFVFAKSKGFIPSRD